MEDQDQAMKGSKRGWGSDAAWEAEESFIYNMWVLC